MSHDDSVTDQEERKIMKMFYDWDTERKVMLDMQKCQRNWDYKKFDDLHPELIKQAVNELIWTATNSPTKQHEGYFDVYYTKLVKLDAINFNFECFILAICNQKSNLSNFFFIKVW